MLTHQKFGLAWSCAEGVCQVSPLEMPGMSIGHELPNSTHSRHLTRRPVNTPTLLAHSCMHKDVIGPLLMAVTMLRTYKLSRFICWISQPGLLQGLQH